MAEKLAQEFFEMIGNLRFIPNSPTFTGAGTPLGQLAACFVVPIEDDMGRIPGGIFQSLRDAALIQQTGGGNGFSFSRLRPKNALVTSSMGQATGPLGFLRVYDVAFGEIAQGGCLLPETLVFTTRGLLRLDEIVSPQREGWQEHQLSVPTDDGARRSPRGFNNGVSPVLRVRTREGLSLAGTPNHKVKVLTPQGPAWRELRDLRAGERLLVRLGEHRGESQTLRQPAEQHGDPAGLHLPASLDEELAFFVGYLSGAGVMSDGPRIGVSVPGTSYLMEEMPRLLERLFGVKAREQQSPAEDAATLVLEPRAIEAFLRLNGLDQMCRREARVPRLIRLSPPQIVGAFLRGLFEAAGSLADGYPQVNLVSPQLATEVATLLIGLGAPAEIRRVPAGAGRGDSVYQVRVASPVGLKAWRRYVGADPRSRLASAHTGEVAAPRELYPAPDTWFVHVAEVVPEGEQLTLDLEVADNHTYLAHGIVTHNSRRGANMAVLRVDHPDIESFVTCKTDEGAITNFNISVGVLDAFMEAVEADRPWPLRFPDVRHPAYREFHGPLEAAERAGIPIKVYREVRARKLFEQIVKQAWRNGEPGMLFLDAANRDNPLPNLGSYESTNPCGEQFLLPYESCCLGSVNLARHLVVREGVPALDWEGLAATVALATRFLDDVVDANGYVPAVPQLREAAQRSRRIGLGIMGLADVLYHLGLRYGSREGQELAAQVMEFVRFHAMKASIALAQERGPFPAIAGSVYDPANVTWTPPQWPAWLDRRHDWGRPALDWAEIVDGIRQHGIRNAAQLTIAPTGTIATVAGVEGYGCEPVFALAYTRYVQESEGQTELRYVSPAFRQALERAIPDESRREAVLAQVQQSGSCQAVDDVPAELRHVFVVAGDITPEEHVRMQAALQTFVDASISKTVNLPHEATEQDVADVFTLAWKLGCKGVTVYRSGSREVEVLETAQTKATKQGEPLSPTIRPRPQSLHGVTYQSRTPVGTAFITININGGGQPFEVFVNVGKAGSDIAAMAEGIGRLISLTLRIPSPMPPRERLREVAAQLRGIGGRRSWGYGPDRVLSLPDGIARVLAESLADEPTAPQVKTEGLFLSLETTAAPPAPTPAPPQAHNVIAGDICPVCGEAALVRTEGCIRCMACGHSEC